MNYNLELLTVLNKLPLNYPASVLYSLAFICEDKMGGASGALYSLLLTGAAGHLSSINYLDWTGALKNALDTAMKYSSARKGDKTMVIITFKYKLITLLVYYTYTLSHLIVL